MVTSLQEAVFSIPHIFGRICTLADRYIIGTERATVKRLPSWHPRVSTKLGAVHLAQMRGMAKRFWARSDACTVGSWGGISAA